MGNTDRPGKSYTAPKGKATTGQTGVEERNSRVSPTVEWIIVGVLLVAAVVAIFVFTSGSDTSSPHNGSSVSSENTWVAEHF